MTNKDKKKAREHAILMMYQWDISKEVPERISDIHWEENKESNEVKRMAEKLFLESVKSLEEIDPEIERHLKKGWVIRRLLPMDRAILRVASYEIIKNPGYSPPLAVINDAVELAKLYGEDPKSPSFINAILDKIYHSKVEG